MNRKAISTVVSAALIIAIALGLTSTAYIWGKPLIEKRQEATTTERVFNQLNQNNANSLPKLIEDVANNRGTRSFTIGADGIWKLNEGDDSVEFTFVSKTSNIAANTEDPISLTSGVQCVMVDSEVIASPHEGTLGQDSSSVVCVKAVSQEDFFTITYTILFRELYDNPLSDTANGFKIDLEKDPAGLVTSTGKTVKISFIDSEQLSIGSKTLITKKIKILLI